MEQLRDKKMIFIFDECHRSQFGATHNRIKSFFNNVQMFGFTGTPIFAENAAKNELGKRTTVDLFDQCLHKYVITDAIRDENVLKFSVEYVGRYKQKETSKTNLDINVEDIDTSELLESPERLGKIADYVIANHSRKTHNRAFTSLFCAGNIKTLIQYYDIFQAKKNAGDHQLKIATIFSYGVNEDDPDATGSYILEEPSIGDFTAPPADTLSAISSHSRDKLEEFIGDYNQIFGTKFTTKDSQSFYNYYNDIARRVKNKEVDVLLVVNMFLTGFDSPNLNTLYVDKNLRYHGLIQAFSRTNRILNELKSQGNIVSFRNLKAATDEAITLFSNKDAIEVIIIQPIEDYIEKFNSGVKALMTIVPTIDSVNDLETEADELMFIKSFRELIRVKNVLETFADFSFDDLEMTEQNFADYRSKYLDLYDKVKGSNDKEKVSILDDVDFEVELLRRDEINVYYILRLLSNYHNATPEEKAQINKKIADILSGDIELRSKRELILEFIDKNLPEMQDEDSVIDEFEVFWNKKQVEAFNKIAEEEHIPADKLTQLVGDYLFTERLPLSDTIIGLFDEQPKLFERKKIVERIREKIVNYVEVFINGIAGI
jgi:type I restriction enzyme R subunit